MSRGIERLSAVEVARLTKPTEPGSAPRPPRRVHDGGGLYLIAGRKHAPDASSWVFRYMVDGQARTLGLGSYPAVSLATARKIAASSREKVALHRHKLAADPIAEKHETRIAARVTAAKSLTFEQAAQAYIDSHKAGWRNAAHRRQWEGTLETYAFPIIGALPVQAIDTALVTKVLEQPKAGATLWTANPDTASRLRGRIETVLDWAKVRGHRTGENPARWKGHLAQALPKAAKNTKHHAAIAIDDLPAFAASLARVGGVAARCLEFTILTGVRTSEALGATWGEFHLAAKSWTIPAERMKGGRKAHRVPLSGDALAIVETLRPKDAAADALVFPGMKSGQALSNMSMAAVLKRMNRTDVTVHGFRSTLSDWATERTSFPSEVREMALAHTIPSAVERAYRRGDLFDRRVALMEAWAAFCAGRDAGANVTPLRGAA